MKRILALMAICAICIGLLAGCGDKVPGNTQTSGTLTVFVPEGWTLVGEENDPSQAYLYKGESGSTTYIKVRHYAPGLPASLPNEGICQDVQPVEAQAFNGLTFSGFAGTKATGTGTGYVTYLCTQDAPVNFFVTLWCEDETQILDLEDAQVRAILNSLATAVTVEDTTQPVQEETRGDGEEIVEDTAPTSPEEPLASEEETESQISTDPNQ